MTMSNPPKASRNPFKRIFARKEGDRSAPDRTSQLVSSATASALPSVNTSLGRAASNGGNSTAVDAPFLSAASATESSRTNATLLRVGSVADPARSSATLLPGTVSNKSIGPQSVNISAAKSDPTQPLDFWGLAFTSLPSKDQELLKNYLLTPESASAQLFNDILKAACEKRDVVEARKWTAHVMGRQVSVRSQADLVIRWLDRFKAVGDVAVNADPVHAGLPWAAIRFLIQVSVDVLCMPFIRS